MNGVCLHCGGRVDAEGYSDGGEVEGEPSEELHDEFGNARAVPREVGSVSVQQQQTDEMRDAAFASSLRGGRR